MRRPKFYIFAGLVWMLGIASILYGIFFLNLYQVELTLAQWIPLRCPLKWVFDTPCPTCGLGRSLIYFFLGGFKKSFDFHFLGFTLGILFLMAPLLAIAKPERFTRHISPSSRKILWALLINAYLLWGFYFRDKTHL